jgi:NADH:ubiquinone oxidoreductase subunit K
MEAQVNMDFVILSLVMLSVGIYGLLTNRQLLKVFISVELIATAATLNFVMLVSSAGVGLGQAFLVLAFATDTAVSGIILALLVIVSKRYGTSDMDKIIEKMQGKDETEVEQ